MNDYLKERDLWWPVSPELMAIYKDGSHSEEWEDGTLKWFKNHKLHRAGDKPAIIWSNGTLNWAKNGDWHRDGDKPAYINAKRSVEWYKNGKLHRNCDNPAYIGADGTLWWFKNGLRHRTTGPAVIYPSYKHEYWVNDVNITKEVESWLKSRKYKYPFTPEQQVEFVLTFS
jgi:hypothetical protein